MKACFSSEIQCVFDVGSGKIKMQVAKVFDDRIEPLCCDALFIADFQKPLLDEQGMISKEREEKIFTALRALRQEAAPFGASKSWAFATELFRLAKNGSEVAQKISEELGIDFRIISVQEEGMLSFLTVVEETKTSAEDLIVLDIGGGSLQITCRENNEFLVYSAPLGRIPTYQLMKNNQLSLLQEAFSSIDEEIVRKIQNHQGLVVGVGAHPKKILEFSKGYNRSDVQKALLLHKEEDMHRSDLLLVDALMESLNIERIEYKTSRAGNTSGALYWKKPASRLDDSAAAIAE